MNKFYILAGILLVTLGLIIKNAWDYDDDIEESDYNIAMMHAKKVYDEGKYDVIDVIICDDTDDEIIHYEFYGDFKYIGESRIYRNISYDCLTGYYDDIHD